MNENRFRQKYRIDSARLTGYDYGANGLYFVTICTQKREHFFGEILSDTGPDGASLQLTAIGQIAVDCWLSIPDRFSFVELDAFQLMPNHLHGVLWINKPDSPDWQPNQFGPQLDNLPAVIRGFKAGVTKQAIQQRIDFGWQTRYYDRIVRNDDELNRIRTYIADNPARWEQDKNNMQGLYM